jgi:hypothetical protein
MLMGLGGPRQVLDLEKNNIREAGGVALAGGLAKNTSVRVVNLLSQQQPPGDAVCVAFVELFDTNVTLLKVRTPSTPRSSPHPFGSPGAWDGRSADMHPGMTSYALGGSFGPMPHSHAAAPPHHTDGADGKHARHGVLRAGR